MFDAHTSSDGPSQPALAAEPWLIVITASAGGIAAVPRVLSALPEGLNAAVAIVQHRLPHAESRLHEILGRGTPLPVRVAAGGESIEPSTVYIARPDLHLTVAPGPRFSYVDGRRIRFVRSSANPLLASAAELFRP